MKTVTRALRAFGHFWWDFLVGDTPELFAATVVIVGTAFLLRHEGAAGIVVLPVMAVLFLMASSYRGRRRSPGSS